MKETLELGGERVTIDTSRTFCVYRIENVLDARGPVLRRHYMKQGRGRTVCDQDVVLPEFMFGDQVPQGEHVERPCEPCVRGLA